MKNAIDAIFLKKPFAKFSKNSDFDIHANKPFKPDVFLCPITIQICEEHSAMLTWQKRIHIFTCQLRYAMTRNVLSLFFVFSKILWHEFRVIISIPSKKPTKLLKKTIKKKCFSKRNTSGNTEFTFLNKLWNGEHYV